MNSQKIWEFLATDFYLGKLPYKLTGKYYGGGTIGTLFGLVLVYFFPFNDNIYFAFSLAICFLSFAAASGASALYKTQDDQRIIIDETAGYMLSLVFLPKEINYLIIAFVFFRIYDGLKPWPIRWLDKNIKGGLGITLDDMAAGIFTNITLRIFMH
ncbi:MAG: phosphatidylglycerophosphatase A [Elusimicrobiota bacterium]